MYKPLDTTERAETSKKIDGRYIPPDLAAPLTIDFLSAYKYDATAKSMSKRKDTVFRYREQVQSWKIRKKNNLYIPSSHETIQINVKE